MRICNFYFSDFHLRRDSCPSGRNVLIFVCASKHIQGFHSKLVNFQLTLTLSQLIVSFSISKLSLPPIEIVTYNLNWHLSNLTCLLKFVTCHCSNWNCASNSFVRTTTKQKQNLPLWLEHKSTTMISQYSFNQFFSFSQISIYFRFFSWFLGNVLQTMMKSSCY